MQLKGLGLLPSTKIHASLQRSTFCKELRFLLRRLTMASPLNRPLANAVMIFVAQFSHLRSLIQDS